MKALYLDASALVKLVVAEPQSAALEAHLRGAGAPVTCALSRVEVPRAVRRHGAAAISRSIQLLDRVTVMGLDDALFGTAARLPPAVLRSLDAIHLAAALVLGDDLEAVITYDRRMADAARLLKLRVEAPA